MLLGVIWQLSFPSHNSFTSLRMPPLSAWNSHGNGSSWTFPKKAHYVLSMTTYLSWLGFDPVPISQSKSTRSIFKQPKRMNMGIGDHDDEGDLQYRQGEQNHHNAPTHQLAWGSPPNKSFCLGKSIKSRLMIIWICVKPDWKGKSWRCKLVGCRFLFGPNPETNSSNILRSLSSVKCVTW